VPHQRSTIQQVITSQYHRGVVTYYIRAQGDDATMLYCDLITYCIVDRRWGTPLPALPPYERVNMVRAASQFKDLATETRVMWSTTHL
jgi:hypothetical protein